MQGSLLSWSGIRESNPRLDLGKVAYYHYTNPAHGKMCVVFIYSMGARRGQDLGARVFKQPAGVAEMNSVDAMSVAATTAAR
jgi:hypothetical protein